MVPTGGGINLRRAVSPLVVCCAPTGPEAAVNKHRNTMIFFIPCILIVAKRRSDEVENSVKRPGKRLTGHLVCDSTSVYQSDLTGRTTMFGFQVVRRFAGLISAGSHENFHPDAHNIPMSG